MRIAFKEWAVIVDALGRGNQIVILRKGGISEGRGGFQVDHPRFLLFPTLHHQQRDSVVPTAARRYDETASGLSSKDVVRIEFCGEVAAWQHLDSLAAAERLRGQHVWRDEVIAQRFAWGRTKDICALAVRVFRLLEPVELPMLESYGGCKSWVELAADVAVDGAQPVLTDAAFAAKRAKFQAALEPVAA